MPRDIAPGKSFAKEKGAGKKWKNEKYLLLLPPMVALKTGDIANIWKHHPDVPLELKEAIRTKRKNILNILGRYMDGRLEMRKKGLARVNPCLLTRLGSTNRLIGSPI
ncbi:hypothetical protein SCOR_10050 [Sulfidibacter corallicola]|uniref:Uncharacterized protein n=1 Tax=Sulfidibacter corallicola TaxID=2818388 RepID=A0A8A4TNX0_SULCO|nr:hypothetical protein [Sulfidibacter corallicola]QTD50904.1 hypothetical protein J3U87_00415 [Sulfidibacter corallicola]